MTVKKYKLLTEETILDLIEKSKSLSPYDITFTYIGGEKYYVSYDNNLDGDVESVTKIIT